MGTIHPAKSSIVDRQNTPIGSFYNRFLDDDWQNCQSLRMLKIKEVNCAYLRDFKNNKKK
jgi:hypothetical protein